MSRFGGLKEVAGSGVGWGVKGTSQPERTALSYKINQCVRASKKAMVRGRQAEHWHKRTL